MAPELPEDLREALQELPLFPLQNAVLYPGMLFPLHVFEPRYVSMLRTVLETHRSFAIVQVSDPDADMMGRPAIASIAGVGTVIDQVAVSENRYNIMVVGRGRVRVQELSFVSPFRRALATMLKSDPRDIPDVELAALHSAANSFASLVRDRDPSFRLQLPKNPQPGMLADALSHQLILDAREKQQILETLDERTRVRRVTEILTIQRATLESPSTDKSSLN